MLNRRTKIRLEHSNTFGLTPKNLSQPHNLPQILWHKSRSKLWYVCFILILARLGEFNTVTTKKSTWPQSKLCSLNFNLYIKKYEFDILHDNVVIHHYIFREAHLNMSLLNKIHTHKQSFLQKRSFSKPIAIKNKKVTVSYKRARTHT